MTQKYQSFPACEPVHRVMHWTGSAIRTFSQIIPDVLRKRFTRKYPRFESEFKTRAWYCLGHDKPSSVSFVAVYGKKPEYPVACCRDEWQAGDGGGNPQVFPWKMPRSLLRGSSRLILIRSIDLGSLLSINSCSEFDRISSLTMEKELVLLNH